jgi:hypothetical protein
MLVTFRKARAPRGRTKRHGKNNCRHGYPDVWRQPASVTCTQWRCFVVCILVYLLPWILGYFLSYIWWICDRLEAAGCVGIFLTWKSFF